MTGLHSGAPGEETAFEPDRPDESVAARVGVGRWWVAGMMSLLLAVVLTCALIGVPPSFFSEPSPMMNLLRLLAIPGAPLAAFAAWFYLNGALRPQHVTVDADGVSTPAWRLGWEDIIRAEVQPVEGIDVHKQQLAVWVTDSAFARVRGANRGHSGVPFGMGGLPASRPIVRTQFGTTPAAEDVLPVIQRYLDVTPFPGGRPRWPNRW
jgi:hypothetical protein